MPFQQWVSKPSYEIKLSTRLLVADLAPFILFIAVCVMVHWQSNKSVKITREITINNEALKNHQVGELARISLQDSVHAALLAAEKKLVRRKEAESSMR